TALIAGKVKSLAVNKLAHAAARNEHADRAFGGTQPFAEQTTETGEFFGIRPHQQYLDVILVEFALPEFLGHLSHPPVGEVETPRPHSLRQPGSTGSSEPCLARTVDAPGDKVGELGCREIDHAGKAARCSQHLERTAAWPRGMKSNDLKSFRLQSLCDAINRRLGVAEGRDAQQRNACGSILPAPRSRHCGDGISSICHRLARNTD